MTQQAALIDLPEKRDVRRLTAPCPPHVKPGLVPFVFPGSVRRLFRRPKMMLTSEWAEKCRVLEEGRPRPGPWKNSFARYGVGIMDVFLLPYVRQITVAGPAQTIKTEIQLNCLGSTLDQAPGSVLMVYDQQDTAKTMCTGRVKNMITESPTLRELITGKADDFGNYRIKLKHTEINFAWATSVAALANRSFQYVFSDETAKYETTSKTEAGPVARLKLRVRAYEHTSKVFLTSSVTTKDDAIGVELARAQAMFEYFVVCPNCGVPHLMVFSGPVVNGQKTGVVWPDEADGARVKSDKLARYVCPHCLCQGSQPWDDYMRDQAVDKGFWVEKKSGLEINAYMKAYRPQTPGFQYSTLISPLVSLSETASEFIFAKQELKFGRIDLYKNWLNGYMGEPWEEDFSPRKFDAVLALRDTRPAGLLPNVDCVAALIGEVDTQDEGFWYEIRAYGYGLPFESWQVREGYVENFEDLDKVLWIPYYDADGRALEIERAVIDTGGHRTTEVIEWCLQDRGRRVPSKGMQTMKRNYRLEDQECWPGTDKKIPGGIKLLLINTKYYKDWMHRKLQISSADPGAYHMNSECTEDWAQQICAEYTDERGMWLCPKHKANHAWDVSVYGLCLADFLGVRYRTPEPWDDVEEEEAPAPPPRRRRW